MRQCREVAESRDLGPISFVRGGDNGGWRASVGRRRDRASPKITFTIRPCTARSTAVRQIERLRGGHGGGLTVGSGRGRGHGHGTSATHMTAVVALAANTPNASLHKTPNRGLSTLCRDCRRDRTQECSHRDTVSVCTHHMTHHPVMTAGTRVAANVSSYKIPPRGTPTYSR